MVSRYFAYRQALLEEARRLVRAGVLREKEDIFYLRFQELQEVARTGVVDDALLRARRAADRAHQGLTSEGERVSGAYRRALPAGALAWLAVSAGGLVTEVGGLMTLGAVIAREYGLPAVVGVEGATRRIRDGQRIRVHGAEGYVELLA